MRVAITRTPLYIRLRTTAITTFVCPDIPLANNYEQQSVKYKKNRKPPVCAIPSSKARSVARKGKNNKSTAKKRLDKKTSLSASKVEQRKINGVDTVSQ